MSIEPIIYGLIFVGVLVLVEGLYLVAFGKSISLNSRVNRRLEMLDKGANREEVLEKLRKEMQQHMKSRTIPLYSLLGEKAQKAARRNMFKVGMQDGTLPHEVLGKFCASSVKLIPAAPGTGVIAGGTVRAVLEMAGIHDCLTKAYGSTNKANLAKAVVDGLQALRSRSEIEALRGVDLGSSAVEEMLAASAKIRASREETGEVRPNISLAEANKDLEPLKKEEAPAEEAPAEEAAAEEAPAEATEEAAAEEKAEAAE